MIDCGFAGYNNLTKKMVSGRNAKLQASNSFSPFFLFCQLVLINTNRKQQWRGESWPVGGDIIESSST